MKTIFIRLFVLSLFVLYLNSLSAQTPNQIINTVNERFKKVNNYKDAFKH